MNRRNDNTIVHDILRRRMIPPAYVSEKEWDATCKRYDVIRRIVSSRPIVVIDNVADLYWGTNQYHGWEFEEIPNAAMPFDFATFTWKMPWIIVGNNGFEQRPFESAACVVGCYDMRTWTPNDNVYPVHPSTRFVVIVYVAVRRNGDTIVFPDRCVFNVLENGRICKSEINVCEGAGELFLDAASSSVFTALLGISFMHCKNVEVKDVSNEYRTEYGKKFTGKKLPQLKWHTIHVAPTIRKIKEVAATECGGDVRKALHICRGHFRTYDENSKGLFGRLHGTYFIPQHTRGDIANGQVLKDYVVSPN